MGPKNDPALPSWRAILITVAAVILGGFGITIATQSQDDGEGNKSRSIDIRVDRSAKPGVQPKTLEVPKAALAPVAASPEVGTQEFPLKDETPAGIPDEILDENDEAEQRIAESDQLPIVTPDAAPTQRGCQSNFVRNYSSRRGVAPRWIVVHETVSPNLPGLRDLLGLTARANDPRSQVSWTWNIDRQGNCFYTVRESDKPWTQAAANPFALSVEFVNTTREFPFLEAAGYRKAGLVFSDAAKRWNIPLVIGRVRACAPPPGGAGFITHAMLGACGGGHVDINSHDGSNHNELRRIIAAVKRARRASAPKLTKQAKWSLRHAALHKLGRPLTREERVKNRKYHELLKL